jgi:hypothetical protein
MPLRRRGHPVSAASESGPTAGSTWSFAPAASASPSVRTSGGRITIDERDEELMRQWRAQFPSDVVDTEAFFADLRAQRRADRRHRWDIAERELVNAKGRR